MIHLGENSTIFWTKSYHIDAFGNDMSALVGKSPDEVLDYIKSLTAADLFQVKNEKESISEFGSNGNLAKIIEGREVTGYRTEISQCEDHLEVDFLVSVKTTVDDFAMKHKHEWESYKKLAEKFNGYDTLDEYIESLR